MKRTITILMLLLFGTQINAQEKKEKTITSKVTSATVYMDGAEITRKKSVNLSVGTHQLQFIDLSPYIRKESIVVNTGQNANILAFNYYKETKREDIPQDKIDALNAKIKLIEQEKEKEELQLSIVEKELKLLDNINKIVTTKKDITTVEFIEAMKYYDVKLPTLKNKQFEIVQRIDKIKEKRSTIKDSIVSLRKAKSRSYWLIEITVDVKQAGNIPFKLTYFTNNAGWTPSYELNTNISNSKLTLRYKANISQKTEVDWNQLRLNFSSRNPFQSIIAPGFYPLIIASNTENEQKALDKFTRRLPVNTRIKRITGIVLDRSAGNEPLPFVNITTDNNRASTTTDFDGNFELDIPPGCRALILTFVGYDKKIVPIDRTHMRIYMKCGKITLEEVEIKATKDIKTKKVNKEKTFNNLLQDEEKHTAVDFKLKTTFDVESDSDDQSVTLARYNIPAKYQYFSLPKEEEAVYLTAKAYNWKKHNLLKGPASINFEGSYLGNTRIEPETYDDTLHLSFGVDKSISIRREMVKKKIETGLFKSKVVKPYEYKIKVKNYKKHTVKLLVVEPIPISEEEEIEINIKEKSKGKLDKKTGKLSWNLNLAPGAEKTLVVKYEIKFPKGNHLTTH